MGANLPYPVALFNGAWILSSVYRLPFMTATMSTTVTSTSMDNKVCHSLPCSIDYQGMAPVHAFFHPTPINRTDGSIQQQQQQQEVRFRGRKLLAASPPVAVQGMVLDLAPGSEESSNTNASTTSATIATPKSTSMMNRNRQTMAFHSIQEWHHEETLVEIGISRVDTAMGWFPIARAIHEELVVLED